MTDYIIGLSLGKEQNVTKRKILLWLSLSINLGILFIFKYFNFFIESFLLLSEKIGLNPNLQTLSLILPIGISFYTFQTLSYTIDIYRGKLKPTKDVVSFFTFVAFFPQLVAGPIERASNLLPQFEVKRTTNSFEVSQSLRQILWGLFKKVVIADNCALYVDLLFSTNENFYGLPLMLGTVLFAFQIYCDFSGYSDIAIGSARLLGFRLMQNFATPYFARNIAEFWRRWHISLSTWFKDYVFIPLGGSRHGTNKQIRNIFITFTVSGLWHGANWTFIFWGILHACFYLPNLLLKTNKKFESIGKSSKTTFLGQELIQILGTFFIVCIAWVFFRAENIQHAFDFLLRMFRFQDLGLPDFNKAINFRLADLGISTNHLLFTLSSIIFMMLIEWKNRFYSFGIERLPLNIFVRFTLYILLSLMVAEFLSEKREFIYFQF